MSKLQNRSNIQRKIFPLDIHDIKKNQLKNVYNQKDQGYQAQAGNPTYEDTTTSTDKNIKDLKKDNINNKKSFHEIAKNKDEKDQVSKELFNKEKNLLKIQFCIPINELINSNLKIDIQQYIKINENEKEAFYKKNNNCINIENEKKNLNLNKKIKNNENNEINININSKNFFINQNLNQKPYNRINNKLIGNQINFNFHPFYTQNNLVGLNSNQNIYNLYTIYNNLYAKIMQQKNEFRQLKELGLYGIINSQNKNNYLYKMLLNNSLGLINNINNLNQCLTLNNPLNSINYNYYGNQNQLLNNYVTNQNLVNINRNTLNNINNINNVNNLNNLNNISGQNIPEKYTIIIKNNTKDPDITKLSKIKVTTTYLKDKTKKNQENKEQNNKENNKEKSHKNFINIDDIISGKENRTVVRLNPIPPNYSSFDISKLLDHYLNIENGKKQRIYKAIYTPLCKIIGKNLGYCFIMMVKPKYVIDFYKTFNGRVFQKKKCKRPCNVIWANIQGNEFLKTNEDDPIRKPIIFKDIKTD